MTSSKKALLAAVVFAGLTGGTSFAASPQTGLWVVDAENNGKPGRGFSIEVQTGIVVLAYYGYTTSGAPTFYLASGPLSSTGTADISLFAYKGGMALGGLSQSATVDQSPGNAKLNFVTSYAGSITFPGEAPKSISKFNFGDASLQFNKVYVGAINGTDPKDLFSDNHAMFTFKAGADKSFSLNRASFNNCDYTGSYALVGSGITATGVYTCGPFDTDERGTFRTNVLIVDGSGVYNGIVYHTNQNSRAGTINVEVAEPQAGLMQ